MKNNLFLILFTTLICLSVIQGGCHKSRKSKFTTTGEAVNDRDEWISVSKVNSKAVNESARGIPVVYDVDVVVVGGTSGGVAAAVEAAQKGAKVFLAAQRPYLGTDICSSYRLWLEPDEKPTMPLAKKVFAESSVLLISEKGIDFTYEADKPFANVHKDTQPPSVLNDGKWHSASTQSVQYDENVTIIADTGKEHLLQKVHVMAYQRRSPGSGTDFEVKRVTISVSGDNQKWNKVTVIENDKIGESLPEPWGPIILSASVDEKARFVKFLVEKSDDVNRLLLGEIVIEDKLSESKASQRVQTPPTPMHIKRTFDAVLIEAGVEFLFGSYATDVLRDDEGEIAGIVMANRSGRQAIRAKVIIDATPRASVARIAGAFFKHYSRGLQEFNRIVIDGRGRLGENLQVKKMSMPLLVSDGSLCQGIEYTLRIPMKDGSFASFANAEQIARDKTWEPVLRDESDTLFQVPPDPMKGQKSLSGIWPGAKNVALDVFRPFGIRRLFVLGGCADMSRDAAKKLIRPSDLMEVGSRIGEAAASEAKSIPGLLNVRLPGKPAMPVSSGDIRENLSGIRTKSGVLSIVAADKHAVQIIGEYDVVVVGGGTGGAPAGISAARQGVKTLVLEYLHGLGGVGTMGFISKYYYGYIKGFTKEIDEGVAALGGDFKHKGGGWNIEWKKQWYRSELRKAGADIWFGVLGCGAFVEDGRVKGVVVATPDGRGVVLAKVVIDSTGNADIAAAAGAECVYTNGTGLAVQGAGLPPRKIATGYTNTDWTFIDDSDVVDVWRAFVVARKKFKDAFDIGQLVDTRERRRIIGDFTMSPMDISLGRTYPDTVVIARSNFDTHGFTIHPMFMLKPPDKKEILVNVPYRCLLPRGLDGILVTGLGISAHRDAMPVIRMQADIQNQGYAAGIAAAMAVEEGKSLRDIDIKALQKHLVEKGNLPQQILNDKDSFPLSEDRIAQAVKSVINNYEGLDILLSQSQTALSLLREAYESADDDSAKLVYAHILGMLGDPAGTDTLVAAVRSRDWDKGWNYTGMGQFGPSLSELDSLIIALGRTHSREAFQPIIEKLEQLDANSEFSHYRAVAIAFETLSDSNAAKSLAGLLIKPGMQGHAFTDIKQALRQTPASSNDTTTRNLSLREIIIARSLYRCGDYQGLGERILKEYASDLRSLYSHHALAVLKGKHVDSGR